MVRTVDKEARWLITGGCGFIGTNLVARLLKENPEAIIRILDNLSVGTREDLSEICNWTEMEPSHIASAPSSIELVEGDIRDYYTCLNACRGIDVIVHLAAQVGVPDSVKDPFFDMDVNVRGTLNLLEASRRNGIAKFIFASSAAPLGEVEPPVHEEKAPRPLSPYGASKLAGEGYCSAYFGTHSVKTIALRFGNVYGPGTKNKSSVVAKFFRRALSGKPIEIHGDGNQTRDFIYIDDLIEAIVASARADIGGEIFQIATNTEVTVNELAKKLKGIVENEIGREVAITYGNQRQGDIRRSFSDISKARSMLGYSPVFDLDRGLRQTFQYFLKISATQEQKNER